MKRYLFASWMLLILLTGSAWAQSYETIRVAQFNILNYPGSDAATRNPEFRKILQAINPDILIVEEVTSSAGLSNFLTNVLNYGQAGTYASAPFNDGPDTDNGMFYKTSKFTFFGPQTVISTALRDINGYRLRRTTLSVDSLDIQIYAAHLKASTGSANEALRAAEAQIWRDHLNSLTPGYFIGGGDFNLYTSSEQAYQNLIGSQTDNTGRLYDPLNTPGAWHSSASFLNLFTQATQSANGGMDDRFDFLLLSYAFQNATGWQYVAGSYTEFGNDGQDRRSASINSPANTAVPDSIADALFAVSDHLPVYLEIRRPLANPATITLTAPNGGESWYVGSSGTMTWTSANLTGNVTLKLNRSYPAGAWETLFAGTANDGSQAWTVTGPASAAARVLVISDAQTSVRDSSNANFSLLMPTVTVTTPNGGESWIVGTTPSIHWSTVGLTGNVTIELNRTYPSAAWESLVPNTANDGNESWIVSGPLGPSARIRVSSTSLPAVADTSDANFAIVHSLPPVLVHERHGDAEPGFVVFTAQITDDFPGVFARLFFHNATTGSFDSLDMTATGNPDEVTAAPFFDFGQWTYFVRAVDSEGQTASTDPVILSVSAPCGIPLAYDDGSADLFNWAPGDSFEWGVRFSPPQTPFILCEATVALAAFHPDSFHSPITLRIWSADGPAGMPGTILREITRGSIGNVIGGFTTPGARLATFVLHDDLNQALEFTGDFYISVRNFATGTEAFGMDTSSTSAQRSVLYDGCTHEWRLENGLNPNTHAGNRMIRAEGWIDRPAQLVVWPSGNDIHLNWSNSGAPYSRIFRAYTPDFSSAELIGSTADTAWILPEQIPSQTKVYYQVQSSATP